MRKAVKEGINQAIITVISGGIVAAVVGVADGFCQVLRIYFGKGKPINCIRVSVEKITYEQDGDILDTEKLYEDVYFNVEGSGK